MRRLAAYLLGMFIVIGSTALATENGAATLKEVTKTVVVPRVEGTIRLQIDPFSKEQIAAGLDATAVRNQVATFLDSSGINLSDEPSLPLLNLRIRSVNIGLDVATFLQLSFSERAMLERNRSMFFAITWSQASLVGSPQKALAQEVSDILGLMLHAFVNDYAEAFQPAQ